MDCNLPSSSVHRVLQARILEWVATSFSRGSSWRRDRTWSPALQTDYLPTEPWGKPMTNLDSILKSRDITLLTKFHLVKAMGFPNSSAESWVPKNWCFWTVVGEDSWESLDCKEIKPVHPKGNQPWILIGRTDAEAEAPIALVTWCEEPTHWKRPWCWERLKAGGEGDDRGWGRWMASPTQWTWVWASSLSWWWTGKPGVLQSMGSQRVGHDWVTELTV